jgi:hypothetical protein
MIANSVLRAIVLIVRRAPFALTFPTAYPSELQEKICHTTAAITPDGSYLFTILLPRPMPSTVQENTPLLNAIVVADFYAIQQRVW